MADLLDEQKNGVWGRKRGDHSITGLFEALVYLSIGYLLLSDSPKIKPIRFESLKKITIVTEGDVDLIVESTSKVTR